MKSSLFLSTLDRRTFSGGGGGSGDIGILLMIK